MPPAPSSRMISYWPRRAPTPGALNGADEGPKGVGVWLGIGVGALDGSGGVEACGGGLALSVSGAMRVAPPTGIGIIGGRMVGLIAGAMRVAPLLGARGSMRPEISLPSSGNIAVRAIGAGAAAAGE